MKKQPLGLLLVILGTTLCIASALSVRGINISPETTFGLSNYLPLSFWIGFIISLSGAYLVSFAQNRSYQLFAIFCLAAIVCFTPALVEIFPRNTDSYWHLSMANYISDTGHLTFTNPNLQYLEYPGVYIIASVLQTLTSLSSLSFLQLFPILETSLWIIGFYALASEVFKSPRKIYLATIVPVVANVFMFRNHFSPSGLAAALIPLLLFLMLKVRNSSSKKWSAVYIFSFFFLVITHPIFPLIFISIITVIFLYERIFLGKTRNLIFMFLFLAIYLGWTALVGTMASQGIAAAITGLLNPSAFAEQFAAAYGVSAAYVPYGVSLIRRIIELSFIVLAAYFIIRYGIFKNHLKKMDELSIGFLCVTFISVIIGLTAYGSLVARALCLVIPLATFVVLKSSGKKTLEVFVLIALLIFPIFTFAVFYYDESTLEMFPSQYTGLTFLGRIVSQNDTIYMDDPGLMGFFSNQTGVTIFSHQTNLYNYSLYGSEIQKSDIICYLESSFANYFYQDGGTNQNSFNTSRTLTENSMNYNKIFDDGGVQIFKQTNYLNNT